MTLVDAVAAVELRARLNVLPAQQKADEVRSRNRMDLAPQPAQGEAVNAGQQPALTPFHGRVGPGAGGEAPLQHHPGDLQRGEALFHRLGGKADSGREAGGRDRAGDFHPTLQDAPEGVLGRGLGSRAVCARVGDGRVHVKGSQHGLGFAQALRGHVERAAVLAHRPGDSGPSRLHELSGIPLPRRGFPNRQQYDREQQVVKLVRVTDVGPGL